MIAARRTASFYLLDYIVLLDLPVGYHSFFCFVLRQLYIDVCNDNGLFYVLLRAQAELLC